MQIGQGPDHSVWCMTCASGEVIQLSNVHGSEGMCCIAGNVYEVLPESTVRSVSIVLMIVHQCFAYAMFIMPVHHMWEKLIKTHDKPYWVRLPSRLPVGETPFSSID